MLSEKIIGRLNQQINKELYSSYLYLSMSCDCSDRSFEGFAAWLRKQSQEEYGHAMKILDYIQAQQGRIVLAAIEKPAAEFESVQKIFAQALAHEQSITRSINEIYELAVNEKDFATQSFLNWFVTEQVEEEASASLIVDKLGMVGASAGSLLYLDKEMGKRAKA